MKEILLIVFFLCIGEKGFSQYLVSSFDHHYPFYFCNGAPQMQSIGINYAFVNLNPIQSVTIDSVVFIGDTGIFKISHNPKNPKDSFTLGVIRLSSFQYKPHSTGNDTLRIRAYSEGSFMEGIVSLHAEEMPPIGFYGIAETWDTLFPGYAFSRNNELITDDTLHQYMGPPFSISDTPVIVGNNDAIYVKACGTQTIDSIYTVGEFSEIQIQNIPVLPHTMKDSDILRMPFLFMPKIPGETHHYLVLHTTSGKYLVWSFEYSVLPMKSVKETHKAFDSLSLYPNPATDRCLIEVESPHNVNGSIVLFNLSGSLISHVFNGMLIEGRTEIDLNLSAVPAGTYYILLNSDTRSIVEKLFVVK
ncbi:MAG TPA: T9SS type A sorting domain-containing protein [Candidatus Kapabacteria bacterium]|nr:T9SS type A sorting domain-containing protein [Candidatus Kapabacteria bacterium]